MMNVNFFEKKKMNILPYIVGGAFLVFLLLIGIYFFLTRSHYENTIESNNQWLSENVEAVVLSREISRLDDLSVQSISVQESLRGNQYPINRLATDIASTIPDENNRVVSFHINNPNQMTLIIENTPAKMAQSIIEDLEERTYVESVQFLHVESLNQEDASTRFEMIIHFDAGLIIEEDSVE